MKWFNEIFILIMIIILAPFYIIGQIALYFVLKVREVLDNENNG